MGEIVPEIYDALAEWLRTFLSQIIRRGLPSVGILI